MEGRGAPGTVAPAAAAGSLAMSSRIVRFACLTGATLLAALSATGSSDIQASGPDRPYRAVVTELASDSVDSGPGQSSVSPSELARQLVDAPDFVSSILATQQALARGGVATIEGGTPYVQAASPRASMTVTVPETVRLAVEARKRAHAGMVTAAELGQMLKDFGWRFRADSDPGSQVMALLGAWVTEARRAPSEPLSFTPLFLDAMASRQDPPVDLAAATTNPGTLRLTALEVELFGAALDRGLSRGSAALTTSEALAAQYSQPCSFIKEATGKIGLLSENPAGLGSQITDIVWGESFGKGLEAGLKRAGVSKGTAGDLGNALAATGTVMRVWKLVELYRSGSVEVVSNDKSLHKPVDIDDIDVLFEANAGVSDADWKAYQDKMGSLGMELNSIARDCLNSVGLPTTPDLSDLAKDAENWRVQWEIISGSPEHAVVSPRNSWSDENGRPLPGAGRLEKPLARTGDHSASTTLLVNLLPETREVHEGGGPLTVSDVTVKASLKTSAIPSLGTFVNGAKGGLGLADSLVELAAGWFQAMVTPKSYATVEVEYEASAQYLLDFETDLTTEAGIGFMKMHVRSAGVPLNFGPDASFPVSKPLELLSFTGETPKDCTYSSDVHLTRPFTVYSGKLISTTANGKAEVTDIELTIMPGDLAGSFTWHCKAGDGGAYDVTFPVPDGELSGLFVLGHVDDAVGVDPASRTKIRIANWQMGGNVFARRTYSQTGPVKESTTFTLRRATN